MHDAHFAVLVGINCYPALGDLMGPVGDAAAFAAWLSDESGGAVPEGNIFAVQAPASGSDATRARPNVEDVVDAFGRANDAMADLRERDPLAWKRSRLYVFVAGHGIVPDDTDSAALLTANASEKRLAYNINLFKYKLWYRDYSPFQELVIFADCCRIRSHGVPAAGPPFTGQPLDENDVVRVVEGYAAQYKRKAREDTSAEPTGDGPRGYFTRALVESLRRTGTAGYPVMRWGDLRGFIGNSMSGLISVDHQRAEFGGDDGVVFGPPDGTPVTPEALCPVTIRFADGVEGRVDLLGGRLEVLGSWSVADGDWRLDLSPGLYAVVRHDTGVGMDYLTVTGESLVDIG